MLLDTFKLLGISIFISSIALADCKFDKTLKTGHFKFTGNIIGLQALHFEYIWEESEEGLIRMAQLEKEKFDCMASPKAWRICTKEERYPKLPQELENQIRNTLTNEYSGRFFEIEALEVVKNPVLVEETNEWCLYKVEQPTKLVTPVKDYTAPFYMVKDYKNTDWTVITPMLDGKYTGSGKRFVAPDDLRHVQTTVPLATKGIQYTYESEFRP